MAESFESEDRDSFSDEEAAEVSVPPLRVVPVVALVLVPVLLVIVAVWLVVAVAFGAVACVSLSTESAGGLLVSTVGFAGLMVSLSPLETVFLSTSAFPISGRDREFMSSSVTFSSIFTDDGSVGFGEIGSALGVGVGVDTGFWSMDGAVVDVIPVGRGGRMGKWSRLARVSVLVDGSS